MNGRRIWTIARWEYLQKVRSKGFIISLILTPLIVVGSSVVPTLLADQGPESTLTVGIVNDTGVPYTELRDRIERSERLPDGQPAYLLANYRGRAQSLDSAIAAADRDALSGRIEGVFVMRDSAGTPAVSYRSTTPSNVRMISTFEKMLQKLVTERRLAEAGIDSAVYNRISTEVDIMPVKLSKHGNASSSGFMETFFMAYAGCFLLMFLILTTGQSLVRSLVEEKSNRIMELLVASSTPQELMWGKLLGLSGLGITQLMVWLILALGALTSLAVPPSVSSSLMGVYSVLPLMLVYIVLGYMFYAAIFIGVGSLVTNEQEAQVVTSLLVMVLVVPILFAVAVVQYPEATYIRVLSHVPVFTPSLMMMRAVTKMPPVWEIGTTIAVMIVSTAFVVWAAGKIFRASLLLYGKRPTAGEIMRWLRAGG
jgi:ABC-2 type transport system permease protein